ncbi:MAG: rRNA (cytosine-C5-)-methyltransferase nop2 [Watsoniomyces obsoletus]|nr:MAG: rRNA (cytosine-C5-)-methyltransferase nop2 [Watsoniomyces obsoletus]
MSKSGVSVAPECIDKFNELKLGKEMKYVIYKINDAYTEVVVEETSNDPDWEAFRKALVDAKAKDKRGNEGVGPRYAVYDFEYELSAGEGKRNKITFIAWSPDNAGIQAKMIYASSKEALKNSLNGIGTEVQANDENDIEYDEVKKQVVKGAR